MLKYTRDFGVKSRQTQPNMIRWAGAKPTVGGISFYITFLVFMLLLALVYPSSVGGGKNLALLLSSTLAFLIGFADDTYNISPRLKFMGQVSCALILEGFGIRIEYFNLWFLDIPLTILWVVGIMNSVNMLDNMDAVTTSVATTIVVTSLIMITMVEGITPLFLILTAIAGGFVGFLFWNWSPARIYMGDTGSLFVGMVLAFVGIVFFWNIKPDPDNVSHIRQGIIPVLTFMVPILDTSFVTIARIRRGVSPFQGGKDHTTHHLAHLGIPVPMVPVVLGTISLVSGAMALVIFRLIPEWRTVYTLLFILYPASLFGIFIFLYNRGGRIGKMKDLTMQREKARQQRLTQQQEGERHLA